MEHIPHLKHVDVVNENEKLEEIESYSNKMSQVVRKKANKDNAVIVASVHENCGQPNCQRSYETRS